MRLAVLTVTAALAGCSPRLAVPTEPAASLPAPGLYTFDDSRVLGTVDGVEVHEGGLSGLDRLADGRFIAVTDRGPNIDAATSEGRPAKRFPVPDYRPSLVLLRFDDEEIVVTERRTILTPDGGPVSGRPPSAVAADGAIIGGDLVVETALGPDGAQLAPDPWGLDAEGVADAGDGTVWICEEYRPSLWRVDLATGRVL
ncbi:MAG TPA: esterase-like activity of phytase family protein, partial [Rubricoccaceae bacterium]